MAESKKINLSKFFRQDSAAPSAVGVRDSKGINPQAQVVMSGKDLSEILGIIQTTTQINTDQKELIRVEDRNDSLLQGLVDGLQQRIFGLQSSLSRLQSEFNQDLLSRQRLQSKQEREKFAERAELSKSMSLTQPTQGLVGEYAAPAYGDGSSDEDKGSAAAGIAGGLLGLGGTLLGNMLDDTPSTGGSGASSGIWKPLLDVIASGEGGYESVNPGKTIPGLTEMTISEAYKKALEVPGGTSAMGRYQLLTDPIGRAKAAGLDPEKDKFSPENQDRIAVHIIEDVRDGKEWLAGKIDDKTFSQGIANEWAGVPNIEGKFSHKGQGGRVKAESVKAALKQVKELNSTAETAQKEQSTQTSSTGSQTTNISSTNVQATQVSAAPSQTAEEIAKEEKNIMASEVAANKPEQEDTAQALTPPDQTAAGGAPIVIPVNNSQQGAQQMEVSSGDSIPGGFTENFNNFYPALSRAVLGIMA